MNFLKTFLAALLAVVAGSVVSFFFWLIVLIGIAASMGSSTPVKVAPGSILKIDLAETVTDAPATNPFSGFDVLSLNRVPQISLLSVLDALHAAAADDRIQGIYLRMDGGGGFESTAALEEFREALEWFKETSGKFVVSYSDTYTQGKYYLASVADRIYLQPQGGMDWTGLAQELMFYKGLMDKLGVKAEVFRPTVCKYKSAVEPYILDKMSPENRAQMQQLVNSLWHTISGAVAESRGIDYDALQQITDGLQVVLPEEALAKGFVDGLVYEDQMDDLFAELGAEADRSGDYRFVTLGDYASQLEPNVAFSKDPVVAIVYASGSIVDGEGSDAVYGNTLARQLARLRKDKDVAAVVLRVNSPGGSALASDVIWREMELLRDEKPVVVSMGGYAASGGYYISCPADVIVADRTTITGSIGVFGLMYNLRDLMVNKLGITFDTVESNSEASLSGFAPLSPVQRAAMMRGVDRVYETFTTNVANGRNLSIEHVLDIAGGRVWTGEDAKGIGLIDEYGGLSYAISVAADKAGLGEDFRVEEQIEQPEGLAAILASLQMQVRTKIKCSELGIRTEDYVRLREALSQEGIRVWCPWRIEVR